MAAFAAPTPAAAVRPRQDAQNSYMTVASALVLTGSINPTASELPLNSNGAANGPINTDPDAYASVKFDVGGTVAANTITSTSWAPTTTLADEPAETSASTAKKESIPVGAVIAAFAAVAAVCLLLVIFFWWRRRRRHRAAAEKERWRMHRQTEKSFAAGEHQLEPKVREGPWEEFKGTSMSSQGVHTPGFLPSPPSTGKRYVDTGRDHLLVKLPPMPPDAGPRSPRRFSVKSTVTGKVNPSNNFASEGHDETLEDAYDLDDSKSTRSRMPLTPGSGQLTFHHAGPGFEGVRMLNPPPKMERNTDSFLTFRSGEMDAEPMRQDFSFPPQPSSGVRALSAEQRTPVPRRAPTQKSHKGGGQSQHGHVNNPSKASDNKVALDNLIAALDTPEQPRQSVVSYVSQDETSHSPSQAHIIPSPSTHTPSGNPFR